MTKRRSFFVFVIVTLIILIYIAFISLDIISLVEKFHGNLDQSRLLNKIAEFIKFSVTTLCVLLVLHSSKNKISKRDHLLMKIAFGFTFIADFYLVVMQFRINSCRNPDFFFSSGAGFFIFAQIALILRHTELLKGYSHMFKALFYPLVITGILIYHGSLVLYYWDIPVQTVLAPAVYGIFLFASVIFAWRISGSAFFSKTNRVLIKTGMTLFMCCDLSIPVYWIIPDLQILIWFFYAPAITLLALSSYNWRKTKKSAHS